MAGPDYDLSLALETNSIELMKRLASTAPTITFLNAADIGDELRAGLLKLVPVREIESKPQVLSIVHRSRGTLDPAANLLANDIRTALEESGPPSRDDAASRAFEKLHQCERKLPLLSLASLAESRARSRRR